MYLTDPAHSEPPPELLRYQLRMLYHCTPMELRAHKGQDLLEMLRDLTVQSGIDRHNRFKGKVNG